VDYPCWAEPDRDALTATLRHIYENRAEAEAVGRRAAEDIAAKHTWVHAAQAVAERLEALTSGGMPNTPSLHHSITPPSYELRKQEALALTRAGDWKAAAEQLEACLSEKADDWDLVNAYSVALFRLSRKEEAKALMRAAMTKAPDTRD